MCNENNNEEEDNKFCPSKFRDKPEGCERNLRVVTLKSEHYDGGVDTAAECETRLIIIPRLITAIIIGILGFIFKNKIAYIFAYLIAGYDVIFSAIRNLKQKQFLDEKFLMSIASIGAMIIREYPEALSVMILYQLGEFLQDKAVEKSQHSIAQLIKIMPDYANREEDGTIKKINPKEVNIGDILLVKAGERIPVDGIVIEGNADIDTSSVTGESRLYNKKTGDNVISGCINSNGIIKIKAEKEYKESTVSKIIELIKEAKEKKSQTENYITKFAKVYTPVVVCMAAIISIILHCFFGYNYSTCIERALTFLVISCPCAFVISVPLTFFAGIGRASKSGILFKGSSYIEQLSKVTDIAFDKTGTITNGIIKVTKLNPAQGISDEELLKLAAYSEYYSNHPIANAIKNEYKELIQTNLINNFKEIAGKGVTAIINGHEIFAGNNKNSNEDNSDLYIEKDGIYIGNIALEDSIKDNAKETIECLKKMGITPSILSGDSKKNVEVIAENTNIDNYYSNLLPADKVEQLERIMTKAKGTTAFVGDGINDSPVLTRSDIGIGMGALGSDSAIEAADVILSDDNLSKIPLAIKISKMTISIAKQNIIFAITIKILFLILGAIGLMTMWGAVFADVGVTLIAVLNSLRTLKLK